MVAQHDNSRTHHGATVAALSAGRPLPASGRFRWPFLLFVFVCTAAAMLWRATVSYPTGIFDLYPLYFGAKAWLQTGNAYALTQVVPTDHLQWDLLKVGNAYPLPAVLLIMPLSFFSPTTAATIWVGLLVAGFLLALRLCGLSLWWAGALPIIDGIRIEQYSILIIIGQILALWSWRTRRPWLLAVCSTALLTKPNQSLFFVIAMVYLARNWRQQVAVTTIVWGGSLLLDPNWVVEWLPTLDQYRTITHQPIIWALALFAIPFLLMRDWLTAANLLQYLTLPFPVNSSYAVGAIPLMVLDDRRSHWLTLSSYLWVPFVLLFGHGWAVALAILTPTTLLALVRHYGWSRSRSQSALAVASSHGD